MVAEIALVVRPLAATEKFVPQFPADALSDYFKVHGVNFKFAVGSTLADDPTDHPDEVDAFCRSVAPQPGGKLPWPGSLLIGSMSVDGPGTNGVLLDMDRRGVCAVFTLSVGFGGDGEDRFEVYAHEIGHLLNLAHADASDTFPTAMNQWDIRSSVTDRKAVWLRAIQHGSQLQRARLPLFFQSGKRQPIGLPLSASCCNWFENPDLRFILPWGSHFKDPAGNGSDDASAGLVRCALELQSQTGSVAQPVDLQVQISVAPGRTQVELPLTLDLRSGLIELYVTPPFGDTRRYRTRSRSCGTARRTLESGRVLKRNYTLLGDANGVLFPMPGRYKLEVALPSLGARSGEVEFYVGPAVGPFAQAGFQSFLAKDLPEDDAQGWKAVREALDSRAVSATTKGFLKSKASARGHQPFTDLRTLRQEASPRVQERDALLRVVRLGRNAAGHADALKRAIDEAEQVLSDTDETNPSIQYLEHVRGAAQEQRPEKR